MKAGSIEKVIIVLLAFGTTIATAAAVKVKMDSNAVEKTSGSCPETAPRECPKCPESAVAPLAAGTRDAIDVIHARVSVREYEPQRPVPAEMLDKLVRAGMAAPTAGNRQPWYFVTVTDRATLDKLGEHPHGGMLKTAGAAIAVVGAPEEGLRGGAGQMWIQDCSAATENILVAVEALGLGAVWLGVYPVPERMAAVRETLGIPEGYDPLSLISIGWPQNKPAPKDKYKPEKIFTDRWGNTGVKAD